MTTEEKYAKLLEICSEVVTNWDKANQSKWPEDKAEDFIDAGDVSKLKEWIKQESDNAHN